jgi:hypothetical protein
MTGASLAIGLGACARSVRGTLFCSVCLIKEKAQFTSLAQAYATIAATAAASCRGHEENDREALVVFCLSVFIAAWASSPAFGQTFNVARGGIAGHCRFLVWFSLGPELADPVRQEKRVFPTMVAWLDQGPIASPQAIGPPSNFTAHLYFVAFF